MDTTQEQHDEMVDTITEEVKYMYDLVGAPSVRVDVSLAVTNLQKKGYAKKVMITEKAELMKLPVGTVVRARSGFYARYYGDLGVSFGSEDSFPWERLTLPVEVFTV